MKKTRNTKRALLLSALSLLLCLSMFVGSTFAWFTDSVTSSGNKIQSGKLELDLELLDKATNTWTSLRDNPQPLFNNDKWEPGYTEIKVLKIENEGTLALKWMAKFISNQQLSILADVIDVYVLTSDNTLSYPADRNLTGYTKAGTLREFVNTIEATTKGSLEADAETYLSIALKMQETAGNKYQELDLGGAFDIQILATQYTYEKDSFDEMYDQFADYDGEISTPAALIAAFTNGGTYKVVNDITVDETVRIPAGVEVALDLNGKTVSGTAIKQVHVISNKGTLTIKDGTVSSLGADGGSAIENLGTFTATNVTLNGAPFVGNDGWWPSYAVNNSGTMTISDSVITAGHGGVASGNSGVVTLNNVDVTSGKNGTTSASVYTYSGGSAVINGGTFTNRATDQNSTGASVINGTVTVNAGTFNGRIEAYYGTPVIKGGTFNNNPASRVAAGYTTLKNADGTYTVIKGVGAANQSALENAIANNASTVVLGNGEYSIPDSAKNKDVTIIGNGSTVVKVEDDGAAEGDIDYSLSGANVVFENVTLNIAGSNYPGYAYIKSAVYNNCTIVGSNYALYGKSVFNNCTFNLNNGYVWTWGAPSVEFNGCTFEDTVGGNAKAILVHNGVATDVLVKDCTFKATTPAQTWDGIPVAAVSIDPVSGSANATVRFEGTNTVDSAFNSLYQVKYADEVSIVTVTIDGVEQAFTAMK